jgi:hypothetical protein
MKVEMVALEDDKEYGAKRAKRRRKTYQEINQRETAETTQSALRSTESDLFLGTFGQTSLVAYNSTKSFHSISNSSYSQSTFTFDDVIKKIPTFQDQVDYPNYSSSNEKHIESTVPLTSQVNPAILYSSTLSLTNHIPLTSQSIQHEFIWLKKMPHATINYRILDIHGVVVLKHNVVLEVDVNRHGIINGTSLLFENLFENLPPKDLNDYSTDKLFIKSSFDYHVFRKVTRDSATSSIDIEVTSLKSFRKTIMRQLTEQEWSLMCQVVSAAHKFYGMSRAFYFRPQKEMQFCYSGNTEGLDDQTVTKKIVIISNMLDNHATSCNAGMESIKAFCERIPIADQVILLKEGTVISAVFMSTYIYDSKYHSFMFSAFEDQLFLGVHWNMLKIDSDAKSIDEALGKILADFKEFLRKDFIVITLMNLIMFFQVYPGLSSPDVVRHERSMFVRLLDSYIQSKLLEWQVSYEDVWNNIHDIFDQFESYKRHQLYEEFEKTKNQQSSQVSNDFVWIEKRCDSPPDFQFEVVELKVNPCSFVAAVILVNVEGNEDDSVIQGTKWSIKSLTSGETKYTTSFEASHNFIKSVDTISLHETTISFENQENGITFSGIMSSTRTPHITSKLEGLDVALWNTLNQIVYSSGIVKGLLVADIHAIENESSSHEFLVSSKTTLSIVGNWTTVMRAVIAFIESFPSFQSITDPGDRYILQREAGLEITLVMWLTTFDKPKNSLVCLCVNESIALGCKLEAFQSNKSFYEEVTSFMYGFDDILRKDHILMTILSSLCLWQRRSGLQTCHTIIDNERTLLFKLLDKYMRSKVEAQEWLTPLHVLWTRVYKVVNTVSSLRILYENLNASEVPSAIRPLFVQ